MYFPSNRRIFTVCRESIDRDRDRKGCAVPRFARMVVDGIQHHVILRRNIRLKTEIHNLSLYFACIYVLYLSGGLYAAYMSNYLAVAIINIIYLRLIYLQIKDKDITSDPEV